MLAFDSHRKVNIEGWVMRVFCLYEEAVMKIESYVEYRYADLRFHIPPEEGRDL
jgi:hypothetical protein